MKSNFRYMDAEQGEFDPCLNTADSITAIEPKSERERTLTKVITSLDQDVNHNKCQ
jgi:hypothetical protein